SRMNPLSDCLGHPEKNVSREDKVIRLCTMCDSVLSPDGHFNPEVVMYRELCAKSQKKQQLYSLQQYYHKLLKQILVSRKELLELAVRSGPDIAVKRKCPARTPGEMQEQRVRGRVCWILREVKTECGDRYQSSDEDASSLPTPRSPSSPTPTVSVRVLSSLSTQDMKTTGQLHYSNRTVDLMSRVDVGRKALFGLARPKRKMRRKKMRRIKVESEDPCQALMPSEAPALSLDIPAALPDTPVPPLPSVKEEPLGEVQNNPVMAEEIAVTFFNLLENILRLEGLASTAMLEEKVRQWQTSPASSLNPRFSSASCWSEMVLPALHFLAGETKVGMMALPSGFTPCVVFRESSQQWKWIGKIFCQLVDSCKLKHFRSRRRRDLSQSPVFKVQAVGRLQGWTDYVVRASTGDMFFKCRSEQQRYDQPHKAFTFRMHGFESQVGPVKGVFDKEMSLNKAREHTLLRSDRPAYVTILSLVQDAAARLPNGEGTRAEICELLKDSQFLAPDVTSAQVNMVVSGALDRLHCEKDPCVKYDIVRKLWYYLHRDRGQEEFEKIHQAQAAAAKARKTLQQKPKLASKPVSPTASTLKEGGGKTSGGLEASHMGGPMSPTPSTLGTPKSPLAPVATTPTKAGIPDLVKTGPGVLLVSPPPIPQLVTLLSSSQCGPQVSQPATSQHSARVVGHQSGSPPRVRVVSAQAARGQQAMLVHQTPRQIRVDHPVTNNPIFKQLTDRCLFNYLNIILFVLFLWALCSFCRDKSDQASSSRTFSTVSSSDSKSGNTIRIMPGLGVIPQKRGQPVSTGDATVPKATSGVALAEGVTIGPSASGSLTLGTATATVRQVPVTARVVSTQPRKLPARIPVPLSVLSQPLKSKSGMTTPILKGNISTNLGRNIILTTMPAGTKLIAGNKPVSFVTAHQLQQLQQQGQTTQVSQQLIQYSPSTQTN
uniref:Nuclear factor related to kappaB binding protein n=1 Tax=Oncorhynchus kisutch TaxID=8019 RepID=A0A8C7L9F1_ONCKI